MLVVSGLGNEKNRSGLRIYKEEVSMNIIWHEKTRQFHLYNDEISYIMCVQPNGETGQLYFGCRIHDREDFSYLCYRGVKAMVAADGPDEVFSMELNRQEYPGFGTTDFGMNAYEAEYEDASRVSNFRYVSHRIFAGKSFLEGLPATYADDDEAMSLVIALSDTRSKLCLELSYTIFKDYPVITRKIGRAHV